MAPCRHRVAGVADMLGTPEVKFNSRRSPMICTHGMVSTSQPLASEIGLRVLKAGGNAAFSATVQAWVKEASEKLAELAKAEEAKAPPPAKPVATDGPEAGTFTFTDNGDEVSVHVICPAGTKGKQVACVIKDATLKVEVTTLPSDKRVVLDGEPFQEVKANDCTWHVEDMDGGMRRRASC